jgi:predicted GNAT superfamily acetyltransferase
MVKIYLKMVFQCLFGLTRRVGAIERLIQTFDAKWDLYGENLFLTMGFQCLFGLTRRVGAIERLIQTFDAK